MGKAIGGKHKQAVRQPLPEVSWDWPAPPVPRTSTLRTRKRASAAVLPRISRKVFRRSSRRRAR